MVRLIISIYKDGEFFGRGESRVEWGGGVNKCVFDNPQRH